LFPLVIAYFPILFDHMLSMCSKRVCGNLCGQKLLQHNGFHCPHYQKIVIKVVKTLLSAKLVFFTNSGWEAFCVSAFCFWSVGL